MCSLRDYLLSAGGVKLLFSKRFFFFFLKGAFVDVTTHVHVKYDNRTLPKGILEFAWMKLTDAVLLTSCPADGADNLNSEVGKTISHNDPVTHL